MLLIIEDHQDFRKVLRHFLELNHVPARIMEAGSGEKGILMAQKNYPKIVIIDFKLGKINGLETARQIKKLLPHCNIIIISAYDIKEIRHRCHGLDICSFLSKDDLSEQLVPLINRIL